MPSRIIELRVKEDGKVIGYEYFNKPLNSGYCYIDIREMAESETEEDLVLHSGSTIQPTNPTSLLIREQYTGIDDRLSQKIYEGDEVKVFPKRAVTQGFNGQISITSVGAYILSEVPDGEMSEDYGPLISFEVEII
jgi:hypothetical protein